jgi:ferritin-like protein
MSHYLVQFFKNDHLPGSLKDISDPFKYLASDIDNRLPDNPEKTTALRKLLEAKDCAVRALIFDKEY